MRVVRVEIRAIAVYAVGVAFGLFYFRDEDVFLTNFHYLNTLSAIVAIAAAHKKDKKRRRNIIIVITNLE